MNESHFFIALVSWQEQRRNIKTIRTQVFIQEQNIPETLEWDEKDQDCLHVIVQSFSGEPVATARLLATGQMGRMAVLKAYRQQGIGKLMLKTLLEQAVSMELPAVFVNAQRDAVGLYRQFGFSETGGYFNEAGIQHIRMIKSLLGN